jgi:uncharacterized Zn finger protein
MNTTTTTFGVTQEQIDKCDRLVHENTNEVFYLVESQTTDALYKVTWNTQFHRLQCTCPAGNEGRGCWHKRAVLAHCRQFRELKKAERIAQERQELEARIRNARPMPMPTKQEQATWNAINASREFKLMR